MPKFKFEGFNNAGKESSGTVEATSLEAAAQIIRERHKVFARKLEPVQETVVETAPWEEPRPEPKSDLETRIRQEPAPVAQSYADVLRTNLEAADKVLEALGEIPAKSGPAAKLARDKEMLEKLKGELVRRAVLSAYAAAGGK